MRTNWILGTLAGSGFSLKYSDLTPARMRHLSIKVNGRLVLPLSPAELGQATLQEILHIPITASDVSEKNEVQKTWVFPNTQLDQMVQTLSSQCPALVREPH